MNKAEPIAYVWFTDGAKRPVFEERGRHYVHDDGGERDYGVWFVPREENRNSASDGSARFTWEAQNEAILTRTSSRPHVANDNTHRRPKATPQHIAG